MNKSLLSKGQIIDNKYTVNFFVKKGSYAETYRVQNENKQVKLLKLIDYSKLHSSQFSGDGNSLELELLQKISHPNLVKYADGGNIVIDNQKYAYIVLDFLSGETLSERLKRGETIRPYEAKHIVMGVLNGLRYLHNSGILHNDINSQNIMLDLSGNTSVAKIIDFGFARYLKQPNRDFQSEGLNPFYMANEAFNNVFSVQTDIFSVGALYYHLLMGLPPYFAEISKYKSDKIIQSDFVIEQRTKPLKFSDDIDEFTQIIIKKALSPVAEHRFKTVDEFILALNGELQIELSQPIEMHKKSGGKEIKHGKGFSAIAGMQELKDTVKLDVIDALNDKERYAEYGLTIPNGMLLYGPPGCGKTFFAEKMAEEIGFNFYQIKPSDIQSKWVNASQENIKNLFDEARENAPSIIFIDELDALVPNRDNSNINHMNTSAVNEFLAQMNNCGDEGIFIVAATNRPHAIDPAVLRSGRLDKHIYLPPPDLEAREKMFRIYLEKRPTDLGIRYDEIAEKTKNFVSSDIKLICDEASRSALKAGSKITNEIILKIIDNSRSSLSQKELQKYLEIKQKFEDTESTESNNRNKIGFKKY